jgi:hypothetical protein
MGSKNLVILVLILLTETSAFSQEKTKKELKAERKIEQQKQTEALVNSRIFVFIGRTAFPQGYKSVNLATNTNYVKFSPDLIDSYMPYYGKAYGGIGYGGDSALKFEGKPEKFMVTKGKKNFQIDAEVKGKNDAYKLSLTVQFEGDASLSITSNFRSSISYNGEISPPDEPNEKK